MKLEDMKRIAEARTKGFSYVSGSKMDVYMTPDPYGFDVPYVLAKCGTDGNAYATSNAEFIAMTNNEFDKLIEVVEAAKSVVRREEIGGYGFEGIPKLKEALKAMEEE